MYFSLRDNVWRESAMAVGQSNHNKGGGLCEESLATISQLKRKTVTLYLTTATIFQNNIYQLWLSLTILTLYPKITTF